MLRILLVLHIFSTIIFLGNIITAAFWKIRADRSGNLDTIANTSRAVLLADYFFTVPGIGGLLITGTLLIGITDWARLKEPWLAISLGLVALVGVIWITILLPLQFRMVRLSREGVTRGALDPSYTQISRLWAIFGGIVTVLPVVVLLLMVLKPWR